MLVKNELINILLENCTTHEEKARLYSLTETEQAVINDRVMGNIYQSALKRKDINFDSIPYSKGDIKKFDGYDNMIATINMLRQLSKKFGIKMNELDIVDTALSNIRAYRKTFTDGFSLGNEFLTIYYTTGVFAMQYDFLDIFGFSREISGSRDDGKKQPHRPRRPRKPSLGPRGGRQEYHTGGIGRHGHSAQYGLCILIPAPRGIGKAHAAEPQKYADLYHPRRYQGAHEHLFHMESV